MTRHNYIEAADTLKSIHDTLLLRTAWLDDRQAREIHRLYTMTIARLFAGDNPRFDKDRFYRAAGLPELADN